MKKSLTVQLGEIRVDASDTDESLLEKAQNHLPKALKRIGEKAAQEAWSTMERELRNSPFKFNSSASEKASFIRSKAEEFVRTATAQEKKNLVKTIFEQLQQQRKK